MRRRPDVNAFLRPGRARPGATFVAEAVLDSPSETPVDGIDMILRCTETILVPAGNHTQAVTHEHYAKRATFPACSLSKGEHRRAARFDLPATAPFSYRRSSSIVWTLEVAVHIPWWLDRHAFFEVGVDPRSRMPPRRNARVYSTHPQGAPASELAIETSLDAEVVAVGSVLSGAVALFQVASSRVRSVKLALIGKEGPTPRQGTTGFFSQARAIEREAVRYEHVLHEGPPAEGAPLPFSIRIPKDAPPTFEAQLVQLRWWLQVVVDVKWGKDRELVMPIEIVPVEGEEGAPESHPARVPPVGRERRTLVWSAVASRFGLGHDAERERLTTTVGDVTLVVGLEQRGEGLFTVASLGWPGIGLELELHEHKWTDALRAREVKLSEPRAEKRLSATARDPERAARLLDAQTLSVLLEFPEIHLDDEGAVLAIAGGTGGVDELGAVVSRMLAAARALGDALARNLAPPEVMAGALDGFRTLAGQVGGRLALGDMSVRDGAVRGLGVSIATIWDEQVPRETVLRCALSSSLPSALDAEAMAALDGSVRAQCEALAARVTKLRVGPSEIEATLPAPLPSPPEAGELLEAMAQLSRALHTGRDLGPYR
jgi:hypothetical protein